MRHGAMSLLGCAFAIAQFSSKCTPNEDGAEFGLGLRLRLRGRGPGLSGAVSLGVSPAVEGVYGTTIRHITMAKHATFLMIL